MGKTNEIKVGRILKEFKLYWYYEIFKNIRYKHIIQIIICTQYLTEIIFLILNLVICNLIMKSNLSFNCQLLCYMGNNFLALYNEMDMNYKNQLSINRYQVSMNTIKFGLIGIMITYIIFLIYRYNM